jgi:chaperonin GroEL
MQKKKISLAGPDAQKKLRDGVKLISDAVKRTLGPYGRNYASGVRGGPILISNDGVSLAREIQGKDELEDMGVRAVKEAATKTNDKAGDGTTTAVVLTESIFDVLKVDEEAIGKNPVSMVAQVKKETETVVALLDKMALKITSREQLISVAEVSVEDEKLAEMIGGAQWDVGVGGTVMAEEHNAKDDEIEFIYGVRIDNGYGTSRIANNAEKGCLELSGARIIVTNKIYNKEQDIIDLKPLFESIHKTYGRTQVVLIGRAFDETALGYCGRQITQYFKMESGIAIYPVNAPYEDMEETLEDLAAATGAKYINVNERRLMQVTTNDVGTAEQLLCTRYEGIITGKKRGEDEVIDGLVAERVKKIEEALKGKVTPFEKRRLEARLSQLTTGTARIKVGAETEQERKYRKDKVDDAVNAVKAAMQEGVVPGAGLALKTIADENPTMLIADALRAPHKQIMENAGGEFEVPSWVQDPLKVVRTGFEKASSIARSLATTEVLVTWEWEKPTCHAATQNVADDDE